MISVSGRYEYAGLCFCLLENKRKNKSVCCLWDMYRWIVLDRVSSFQKIVKKFKCK